MQDAPARPVGHCHETGAPARAPTRRPRARPVNCLGPAHVVTGRAGVTAALPRAGRRRSCLPRCSPGPGSRSPASYSPGPPRSASGAPDRLLCPDPVRYMSVIMGPAEHATAYGGGLRRWPERVADAGAVASSRRSARYNERSTGRWGGLGRRVRSRRGHSRPPRAGGLQTACSGWQFRSGQDSESPH
jgi:hypothetical protein